MHILSNLSGRDIFYAVAVIIGVIILIKGMNTPAGGQGKNGGGSNNSNSSNTTNSNNSGTS